MLYVIAFQNRTYNLQPTTYKVNVYRAFTVVGSKQNTQFEQLH